MVVPSVPLSQIDESVFSGDPKHEDIHSDLAYYLKRTLQNSNNLSDLVSAATARTNLGLGTAATTSTGTGSTNTVLGSTVITTIAAPTGVAATDTAAILAACTTGAIALMRPGTYVMKVPASPANGCISISNNNVVLAGCGSGVTTLKLEDGATADVTGIIRTASGVQNSKITFRDFTVDGNAANTIGSPEITGFYCGVTPNSTDTDTDITCENIEIKNCTAYGFDPHERTTRLRLVNCISINNGTDGAHDGFTLDACYDSLVTSCIAAGNGRHGFNLVTASTDVVISGCQSYSNGSNGITLQNGAKRVVIAGNDIRSNTGYGIVINGTPQSGQQDNTPGGGHVVVGNRIEGNTSGRVNLVSATANPSRLAHNGNDDDHPTLGLYTPDTPVAHGLLEWNYDPVATGSGTGQVPTAGVGYGMQIVPKYSGLISSVVVVCGTAGASLSGVYFAVYDIAGTQLGITADSSGSFTTTGVKTLSLSSQIATVVAGQPLFVFYLCASGSPTPALVRGGATGVTVPNIGLGASFSNPYRFFTYSSGLTTPPATLTASTMSGTGAFTYWSGLS